MPLPSEFESITGARELFDWFGYWPDFHDAEILAFKFELGQSATLTIHTWELTDRVAPTGFYETTKHLTVQISLQGISRLEIEDPCANSILLSLAFVPIDMGFRLRLAAAYGLAGEIDAEKVFLEIEVGKP